MPRADKKVYDQITAFIYETGIHSQTPRSGLWFVGSGEQSIAEHMFHTAMIAYALAYLEPAADKNKVVLMALFHDIGEGRTSDHNYVHQRYGRLAEAQAVADMSQSVPFGAEILELFNEERARETLEAKLVKDADIIEWMVTLRGEEEKGNKKATKLINIAKRRVQTKHARELCKILLRTNPDAWWLNIQHAWKDSVASRARKTT